MPARNPRPCTSWPCPHDRPCPIHDRAGVAERERDERRVRSREIYNSAKWKRLRVAFLRAHPWCNHCPPTSWTPATEVDHVLPIEDGGDPWDENNLRPLCRYHHAAKTAEDVKLRRSGARRKPEAPRPIRRRRRQG